MVKKIKQKIRENAFAKRDALGLEDVLEKSAAIKEKLFALREFNEAERIMFYSSFKSEVRTMEMIEEALCMGKKIVLPITQFKENELKFVEVDSSAGLVKNEIGIPEPRSDNKKEVDPKDLDLIVAPGVAFTEDGKRLGQGWGFFDRIFAKSPAKRIGISFEEQMVEDIPMEEHDQLMDVLVTEAGVYRREAPQV